MSGVQVGTIGLTMKDQKGQAITRFGNNRSGPSKDNYLNSTKVSQDQLSL